MIAQTLVNLSAGARARLSAIVASLTILLIVLVGAPVIGKLPMAALVGVMMMVAIGTFEWSSFRVINKMPKSDVLTLVVVAAVTVIFHNLALAVLIGVIMAALVFAWESARRIRARKRIDEDGVKHYEIYGPLFFGSTAAFLEKFDVQEDPDSVVIDFKDSRISDMSAIDAVHKITERYKQLNKKVTLRHLSADSRLLLRNASGIIEINIDDPIYEVANQ